MEQRIFHGNLTPVLVAQALLGEFNHGNWRAQQIGNAQQMIVQVATNERSRSGGSTALAITLRQVEDGVAVQIGKQNWLGVAASLGQTALSAMRSPWYLLDRLDDLAQDIESLKLSEQVWKIIAETALAEGSAYELSDRLKRVICEYCVVANPVGEAGCLACGAPLGKSQPVTCRNCGFVLKINEQTCPNCGAKRYPTPY